MKYMITYNVKMYVERVNFIICAMYQNIFKFYTLENVMLEIKIKKLLDVENDILFKLNYKK